MAERGVRVEIDLNEVEKLCVLQCTDEELAAWFGVSVRTIERRRLESDFAEAMQRGRAKGRISVRRMQMKLLEQGNATMGVWLGKNLLGQADHIMAETRVIRSMADLTLEELRAMQSDVIKHMEEATAEMEPRAAILPPDDGVEED